MTLCRARAILAVVCDAAADVCALAGLRGGSGVLAVGLVTYVLLLSAGVRAEAADDRAGRHLWVEGVV